MKIIALSQCAKKLDFRPIHGWPHALPVYICDGFQICGFDRLGEAIELDQSLVDSIPFVYPEITLPELARLRSLWPEATSWPKLLEKYQIRWSEDFEETLTSLRSTPALFQDWASRKKLHVRDLAILKLFQKSPALNTTRDTFLVYLSGLSVTQQEGVRLLELGCEEILKEEKWTEPVGKTPSQWLKDLEQKKFPDSKLRDLERQKMVRKISWPLGVKAKWNRQGDLANLELQISCREAKDVSEKLSLLQSLRDQMEAIWKPLL